MATLENYLDQMTHEGELVEHTPEGALRCVACGHRCLIREGRRGICQVRFNEGGKLRIPWGYVAALAADPVEKKPFFHLRPGSVALTFGMLGCDFHCGYCFTGDTITITNKGLLSLEEAYLEARVDPEHIEIAYPDKLQTITQSGKFHDVKAIFRHPYQGKMMVIKPYYLQTVHCTPDHSVYATDNPLEPPRKIKASQLTLHHFMVVPRNFRDEDCRIIEADKRRAEQRVTYKIPWNFSEEEWSIILTESYSGNDSKHDMIQSQAVKHSPYQNAVVWNKNVLIPRRVILTDEYYLVPLKDIHEDDFDGHVYNMEVEEEHNYLANFLLVSNCQNWITSQALRDPESEDAGAFVRRLTPEQIVQAARRSGAEVIASSYNEPLITSEWAAAVFKPAIEARIKCVYVSNGNGTPEVLEYIRPYLSGMKIDLKSMQDKNYRQLGGVLKNVLDTIKRVKEMGLWLEVVTLVVPGFNDSNEELWEAARYLASISADIPWHVTAFHSDYKMSDTDNTPAKTIMRAAEIGREAGLHYVYAGNLPGKVGEYEDTCCPKCNTVLVRRSGFYVHENLLTEEGKCPNCGEAIAGVW